MFVRFIKFLVRWTERLILLAALVLLGLWLFYIGREHQIFLDNRTFEDYRALPQVNVSVNNGEVSELTARERDVKKIIGPKFTVKIETFNENGEISTKLEREIKLCFLSKDIMINLPSLAAGNENFILAAPR